MGDDAEVETGGGVGLAAYTSVLALSPGADAHKRPDNPLEQGDTPWQSQVLFWVALLPPVPAVGVVVLGTVYDNAVLLWAGGPVSLATGVLLGWWLGRLAIDRLRRRGPELLHLMQTGHPPREPAAAVSADVPAVELTRRDRYVAVLSWVLGPICLVPQGLVPVVVLLAGADLQLWFLALHAPDPLRWPVAVLMILLGAVLLRTAIQLTVKGSKPPPTTTSTDR